MSQTGTKHKEGKVKKPKSERRPLQLTSGNAQKNSASSRENHDAKSHRGVHGNTSSNTSHPRAPKFIHVKVSGTFESNPQSSLLESYMASTTQMPGMQGGTSGVMNAEMFGNAFHLITHAAFDWKLPAQFVGVLDTGASAIMVNRQHFLARGLETELDNSLVGNDKYLEAIFPDPSAGATTMRAPLHKSKFAFGGPHGNISVADQSFYVLERAPFAVLVGVGPPNQQGLGGHELKDAPNLLQNIAKQYSLREIMGIDVSPWRDDGNDQDVVKGSSMAFGGTDVSRYDESTTRYVACSAQSHYVCEAKRITAINPKGKKVDLWGEKVQVIVDSGSPYIMLPESIWRKFSSGLESNGIKLFDVGPRLKTIEKRHFARLKALSFHLVDVDGAEFSIEIPPAGQVFPPSLGPALGSRDDKFLPLTVIPSHFKAEITLGIPLFQRRYMILDLTTNPFRVGFAMKDKSNYVNPSLREILNKYPTPDPEKHRGSRGGSSQRRK